MFIITVIWWQLKSKKAVIDIFKWQTSNIYILVLWIINDYVTIKTTVLYFITLLVRDWKKLPTHTHVSSNHAIATQQKMYSS